MSISLSKGQKISLSKEVEGLSKVVVGLGWDAAKKGLFGGQHNIDCDASAIILDNEGKYVDCVYYGAYIAMKTTQGNVVPWVVSQTDILAEDWFIVDKK